MSFDHVAALKAFRTGLEQAGISTSHYDGQFAADILVLNPEPEQVWPNRDILPVEVREVVDRVFEWGGDTFELMAWNIRDVQAADNMSLHVKTRDVNEIREWASFGYRQKLRMTLSANSPLWTELGRVDAKGVDAIFKSLLMGELDD